MSKSPPKDRSNEAQREASGQNASSSRLSDQLLDQCFFELTEEQYGALLHLLDDPPLPNEALKRLMSEAAPWES